METFFQVIAAVMLTVIVAITLDGHGKVTAVLLVMLVSVMVLTVGVGFLRPVLELMHTLSQLTDVPSEILEILFKSTLICLISEISILICQDSGHSSLGKAVQMLSNGTVLWLSLPLFREVLDILRSLTEGI